MGKGEIDSFFFFFSNKNEQKAPSIHLRFWRRVRNNTDQLKWVFYFFTYRLKKWTCIKLLLFKSHRSMLLLLFFHFVIVDFMWVLFCSFCFRNRLFLASLLYLRYSFSFAYTDLNAPHNMHNHVQAILQLNIKRRDKKMQTGVELYLSSCSDGGSNLSIDYHCTLRFYC